MESLERIAARSLTAPGLENDPNSSMRRVTEPDSALIPSTTYHYGGHTTQNTSPVPDGMLQFMDTSFSDAILSPTTWTLDTDISMFTPTENDTGESPSSLIPQHAAMSISCGCPVSHRHFPSTFADPYHSNIRLEVVCVVAAMLQNCLHLGITESMFCSSDSESPFFRQGIDRSSNQASLVTSVRRIFQTVKPDLRPSQTQITRSHHPYIDIIPFPSIRDALIR